MVALSEDVTEALLARARQGDLEARNELVESFIPMAFKLSKKDDDLRSEMMLKILLRVDAYRGDAIGLRKFVMARLRGTAMDFHEHKANRVPHPVEAIDRMVLSWDRDLGSVEAFQRLLSKCDGPWEREVIELKLEGYTNLEVAKRLGLGKNKVTMILAGLEAKL